MRRVDPKRVMFDSAARSGFQQYIVARLTGSKVKYACISSAWHIRQKYSRVGDVS